MDLLELADDMVITMTATLTNIANNGLGEDAVDANGAPYPPHLHCQAQMAAINDLFTLQNNIRNHRREEAMLADPELRAAYVSRYTGGGKNGSA